MLDFTPFRRGGHWPTLNRNPNAFSAGVKDSMSLRPGYSWSATTSGRVMAAVFPWAHESVPKHVVDTTPGRVNVRETTGFRVY